MSSVQDDSSPSAQQTARLERARAAASAFCKHFRFQPQDIARLEGDPIQEPLIIERDGLPVEVFRWLGNGRGASYVQVELHTSTDGVTVYGALGDREFGPWKP